MRTGNSLEKSLMLGKIKGRRRGLQRMRRLYDILDAMNMNLGKLQATGRPGVLQPMGLQRAGHNWVAKQQYSSKQVLNITVKRNKKGIEILFFS